jgi:hypothetical protein
LYGTTVPSLREPSARPEGFQFALKQAAGTPYAVEYKDSLWQADWHLLGQGTAQTTNTLLKDPAVNSPSRFYRVRAP